MTHLVSDEKNAAASRGTPAPSYTNIAFLNEEEWNNVQHMLDNPSEANDALKTLLARGKQLVSHSAAD